jgi:hypothetical protein
MHHAWKKTGLTLGFDSRGIAYLLILGLYFTFRGYHSLDGDQAYRLPLLLHSQDPALYAADPFVRALDTFNPHRGSLLVLSIPTRGLGLSLGLLVVFVATFLATCRGIDRLASSVWPGAGAGVGLAAVVLVLAAKAGNVGTNHLFEAMVLDRLMALALAWNAFAEVVSDPVRGWRRSALAIGVSALIHPSFGLQIGLVTCGGWAAWAMFPWKTGVSALTAIRAIAATAICLIPGLAYNLLPASSLLDGLPVEDFRILAAELQGPQHMLPHLWRMPQWLAFAGYFLLAGLTLWSTTNHAGGDDPTPASARVRLTIVLGVVLVWLIAAWVAVEWLQDLRITVFQPFRMATVARGLALVLVAGGLVERWNRGGPGSRLRAVLIAVALAGDWMFVVVATVELVVSLTERISDRAGRLFLAGLLGYGLCFLSRHDTESGHWPLIMCLGGFAIVNLCRERAREHFAHLAMKRVPGKIGILPHGMAFCLAWVIPVSALVAGLIPAGHPAGSSRLVRGLVARCRFFEVPVDDVERLAAWCREHTPSNARFIGHPGPKTFRFWSRRSLAFNRAGSPYHAAGLADWFARFQDHVGVHEPPAGFVRAYLAGRHSLEARYDQLDGEALAELAERQGADYVVARSDLASPASLRRLHSEGRYAAYSVIWPLLSQRQR